MYCRNCGQKLEDGDKFCSSCGEKTILASETDKPENPAAGAAEVTQAAAQTQATEQPEEKAPLFEPFDFKSFDLDLDLDSEKASEDLEKDLTPPVEEFNWNIHTFPGSKVEKTEDIDFNWSISPEELETKDSAHAPKAPAPQPESKTPAVETPAPEIFTADEPKLQKADAPAFEPEEKPQAASSLEEELFGDLDSKANEAKKQSQEIDKFFTFNKKNEEFQKLLDREYEKIKSGNILAEEMNTAAAASEEKFASRQPEDPMEELFASEGVVKGYEPKPVETDVLDRIEAAEAEKKAREEAARIIEEEKAKAKAEAEKKAREEAEALAKSQAAEEAARLRLEEEAKRAADARAAQEAAERAQAREVEKTPVQPQMDPEAVRQAQLKAEEEARARAKAEAEARAQAEAEARAKAEAEARAKAELEARVKAEAEARAKAEAEAKAKAEAEARAAAAAKAAEEDPLNHISEMVKARETFFGQSLEETPAENESQGEQIPEKTKAVDKAAILAGMATASEMVQRDRAVAAAEAAAKLQQAQAPVEEPAVPAPEAPAEEMPELTSFLDDLEETPVAEEAPAQPSMEEFDLLNEFQDITEPEMPQEPVMPQMPAEEPEAAAPFTPEPELPRSAEEMDEIPADLFSLDDLMGEEPQAVAAEPVQPEAAPTPQRPVTDETLIMTEESVADILSGQIQQEDKPLEATMVFDSDELSRAIQENDLGDPLMELEDEEPVAEDEDEYEEGGGKGRIALKVCLVVLIVLLVMEVAGVVIKLTASNSEAAKFIDRQLNKVIHLFTGDEAENYAFATEQEEIRSEALEDKTTLIQNEMGKNKDGNIETIEYNADLKFDPEKDYENKDLNLTQKLADITWYRDGENKLVYYDQAIVGAVIAYDSQKVNLVNNNDTSVLNLMQEGTDLYKEVKKLGDKDTKQTFKRLQIGEIRQLGDSYYVWVKERVSDDQNGTTNTERIYEMQAEDQTMKVVSSYEI